MRYQGAAQRQRWLLSHHRRAARIGTRRRTTAEATRRNRPLPGPQAVLLRDPGRGSRQDPWKVSTAEYNYNLRDTDNRVVLAFHWHPAEIFKVRHPHLNLDQGARLGREDLHRTHIPTGRITLVDIIRFVITELGVEPLRSDWENVLSDPQAAHQSWRTWS